MSANPTFQWSSAGRSHVGMIRAINEDACLSLPELGLWAVADGMGGHEAGDIASQMIVETLQEIAPPNDWDDFLNAVREGLQKVNQQLREESARRTSPCLVHRRRDDHRSFDAYLLRIRADCNMKRQSSFHDALHPSLSRSSAHGQESTNRCRLCKHRGTA